MVNVKKQKSSSGAMCVMASGSDSKSDNRILHIFQVSIKVLDIFCLNTTLELYLSGEVARMKYIYP